MPMTTEQIRVAGKTSINMFLKNKPVDQIKTERPFTKVMMARKKPFGGAKENVVEQLRYRYQSNFQWFNGRKVVTYNVRDTIEQASFPWRGAHDGFSLDEDRLVANGIKVVDEMKKGERPSDVEMFQLTDLLKEQNETLREGWDAEFDKYLLRDGTGSSDDIVGLDALVSTTPATGTVGGIDRSVAANVWWRNWAALNLTATTTTGTLIDQMEIMWRNCSRNGGRPNFIMAGSDFLDGYRNFLMKTYATMNNELGGEITIEGGVKMMHFKGVPIVWNPVFSELDTLLSPTPTWEKRCYFLNLDYLKLRPIKEQDMVARTPPRPYDRYEHYWGLTWRGALTMNRGNAHAVLALA